MTRNTLEAARAAMAEPPDVDPGVRRLVSLLRACCFKTTDSGDGKSKANLIAQGIAEAVPHVYMTVAPYRMAREAQRLSSVIFGAVRRDHLYGVSVDECTGQEMPNVTVQATYNPADGVAVLSVHGVADEHLVEQP